MTTLADLTPEERAQCRGMWCEDTNINDLCIYMGVHPDRDWLAMCAYLTSTCAHHAAFEDLTPRLDMPRAWTPDTMWPLKENQ